MKKKLSVYCNKLSILCKSYPFTAIDNIINLVTKWTQYPHLQKVKDLDGIYSPAQVYVRIELSYLNIFICAPWASKTTVTSTMLNKPRKVIRLLQLTLGFIIAVVFFLVAVF